MTKEQREALQTASAIISKEMEHILKDRRVLGDTPNAPETTPTWPEPIKNSRECSPRESWAYNAIQEEI